MRPRFFATPSDFRKWLERNHDKRTELYVGFHKKSSGKPSITWPEAVDQALCFGWIDGVRKAIDEVSYTIRFTPRKPRSNWSAVNVKKVEELSQLGLMHPAGFEAYERRSADRTAIYSYEQRKTAGLDADQKRQFRANKDAWSFFQEQPSSYRQTAIYWVVSAKKEETRQRRLAKLIEDSEGNRRIAQLARPAKER